MKAPTVGEHLDNQLLALTNGEAIAGELRGEVE